ncbi:hypothetical protein KV692_22060 [Xanthomonas euvesicatoria pv. physalidis]|uniref:hypothetical protein n=1 Tax=Xanthomonas euvesicatoria TaxID=456327 RepID=UPI001C495E7C|nr:hypothetical protein [Xanthomonas euvesicatoria]MBV6690454.1 hypothetical protein [Xanthomonas euvesicatoria pv. physalidis]MBV6795983.1 hypothetical protein [Xanthomonas campestris pv. daturae]
MKNLIQFCREIGPLVLMCCATGFGIGGLVGYAAGMGSASSVEHQIQRDEAIQQLCIDGNDGACRVMEFRK